MVTLGLDHLLVHFKLRGDRGDIEIQALIFYNLLLILGVFYFIVYYFTDDMPAASTRQYNLCSSDHQTVQLPVELHMVEDITFLNDLLASQKTPGSGQVFDNYSSINDSDCESLIASYDKESEPHPHSSNASNFVHKMDLTASDTGCSSQQAINMQILSQLQSLGKRLDAMEKKTCKNSTGTSKIKS